MGRLDIEALSGLLVKEVKHVLKDIAWRKVREGWGEEARGWPKLELIEGDYWIMNVRHSAWRLIVKDGGGC